MMWELDNDCMVAQNCVIFHNVIVIKQQNVDFRDEAGCKELISEL